MLSKCPDQLSENDKIKQVELNGSDCKLYKMYSTKTNKNAVRLIVQVIKLY